MNEYLIPVTTSCSLVTLSYVANKLQNRMQGGMNELILIPMLTGFASILMMLMPMPTELIMRDLRYIPIIMAGLRLGLPAALLSTILPAVYSIWLDQPFIIYELLHGLLLPALISALLYYRNYRSVYNPIRLLDGVTISVVLITAKTASAYFLKLVPWPTLLIGNGYMLAVSMFSLLILIGMHNDERKNWLLHRRLEMEANHDRLTGLPNLRSFVEIADKTLQKKPISILMIDIDNFKNYNDTLGHMQGDQLLREAGQLLRASIGEQDYIARYGGEEFIIMCHSADRYQLSALAQRLCDVTVAYPFAGREVQPEEAISISIGISHAAFAGDDLHRVIAEADQALYDSKHSGKNRFSFYTGTHELRKFS